MPKLCSSDAALWRLHRYETDYGIYNHDIASDRDTMSLARHHGAENVTRNATFRTRVERFIDLDVHKRTGLNVVELVGLPRHYVEEILAVCADRVNRDGNAAGALLEQLED